MNRKPLASDQPDQLDDLTRAGFAGGADAEVGVVLGKGT